MPQYRRHYAASHPVFVTVVTFRRKPWIAEPDRATVVLDAMRRTRLRHSIRHLGHVLMPDHLHWLFEPADGNFSRAVATLKRDVSWRLRDLTGLSAMHWQPRFYDHLIRDEADFRKHLDYIHFNPVKHGVAQRAADHPHSSFKAWCDRGVYEPDWGEREPDAIAGMELG